MKKRKKILFLVLLLLLSLVSVGKTIAVLLESGVEIKSNTELIYYLDVTYDGVDLEGVQSSDSNTSSIYSGYIYVEDKLPEGLTFTGFVSTEDGSIGAVNRSDGSACLGYVVDGVDGLSYDESTRTVSFTVKNLKAGCKLTVGIKTMTPDIDDPSTTEVEVRRDFYNTAVAREDEESETSNTVHVWMGSETVNLYQVRYEYAEDTPSNAPALPSIGSYAASSTVGVASSPSLEGYVFNGWTSSTVVIENGSFQMPEETVVLTGSFTKLDSYEVSYSISGDMPSGYVVPNTKSYYPGSTVTVDVLKSGDVFNGYRFLGWTTTDVEVSSDLDFQMPDKNVSFVGVFEEVTYKVTYLFQGSILPSNSDSLLPEVKSYKPGQIVNLEEMSDVSGYRFLGWYKEDYFEMPEEDVVIYGEWALQSGLFEPTITKSIVNEVTSYRLGDVVTYEIVVTNNASYEITDVMLMEQNENASFIEGDNYTKETSHLVKISSIPANGSVKVYSTYTVSSSDSGTVVNEVELLGALADNNYNLDTTKSYVASSEFTVKSTVTICKKLTGQSNGDNFRIRVSSDDFLTSVLLKEDECKNLYLDEGTYEFFEILPFEYVNSSVTGAINSNGGTLQVEYGTNYTITFENKYDRKGFFHTYGSITNKIGGVINE